MRCHADVLGSIPDTSVFVFEAIYTVYTVKLDLKSHYSVAMQSHHTASETHRN